MSRQTRWLTGGRLVAVAGGLITAAAATALVILAVPTARQMVQLKASAADGVARERAAELVWRREFGDPAEVLAAFPPLDPSAAATHAAELTTRLMASESQSTLTAVDQYLSSEARKPGGQIDPPSAVIQTYLATHRADLDSLEHALLDEGPVVLPWNPAQYLQDSENTDFQSWRRAHTGLVARAFAFGEAGEMTRANRCLEAGWSLITSVRGRPTLISQLIAIALMDRHLGALRRLPVDPGPWRSRVSEHDYRASHWTATEMDQLVFLGMLPRNSTGVSRGARADFLDMTRFMLVALRDAPIDDKLPDEPDPPAPPHGESIGSIIASFTQPGMMRTVETANKLILEIELVDRILAARVARATLGSWPTKPPEGFETSRLRKKSWVYSVSGNRLTIALRRSPETAPEVRFDSDR